MTLPAAQLKSLALLFLAYPSGQEKLSQLLKQQISKPGVTRLAMADDRHPAAIGYTISAWWCIFSFLICLSKLMQYCAFITGSSMSLSKKVADEKLCAWHRWRH